MPSRTKPNTLWPRRRLGDLLTRVVRPVQVEADTEYGEIGIRSHCKGIFHKPPVTGERIGSKRVFWIEPECLIFNIIFAWEQAVAITTENERGLIASHRFPMYRSASGELLPEYACLYFSSPRGKYDLALASPGGAGRNKTLGQEEFKRLRIPVPPPKEQSRIVAIISTWNTAIERTEKLIEAKRRLKQGLMQQLLTGKRRFREFGGQVWPKKSIRELCTVEYGKSQAGIGVEGGVYPILGTGGVVGFTDNYLCDEPAIIIGRKGTIDKPLFSADPFWAIDTTFYTRDAAAGVDMRWLYHRMSLVPWRRLNEASGVPSLSRETIYGLRLHIPPAEEQKRIRDILDAAERDVVAFEQLAELLEHQKRGLMQKLLTGKVRVKV